MNSLDSRHLEELKTVGGDELVEELISIFFNELPSVTQKIASFDVDKDQKNIGEFAHRMKSSTASLGLIKMSQYCAVLEKKVKNTEVVSSTELSELLSLLEQAHKALVLYKIQNGI